MFFKQRCQGIFIAQGQLRNVIPCGSTKHRFYNISFKYMKIKCFKFTIYSFLNSRARSRNVQIAFNDNFNCNMVYINYFSKFSFFIFIFSQNTDILELFAKIYFCPFASEYSRIILAYWHLYQMSAYVVTHTTRKKDTYLNGGVFDT